MNQELFNFLMGEVARAFYSIPFISDRLESPLILVSRNIPMVYLFAMQYGGTGTIKIGQKANGITVPRTVKNIVSGNKTTSHTIMTDTVMGSVPVREFKWIMSDDVLGEVGNYLSEGLKEVTDAIQIEILPMMNYIKILEARTALNSKGITDTYMLISGIGDYWPECVIRSFNANTITSRGRVVSVEGGILLQKIESYDISSIFAKTKAVLEPTEATEGETEGAPAS